MVGLGAMSRRVRPNLVTMALYQDPLSPRLRPDLVGDLMTVPATLVQHQIENQATTVLAWLADRSLPFAKALAGLCFGACELAESVSAIGARTQVSLPSLDGRTVFPDLSLDGADRSFQILLEVKVDATFHEFTTESGMVAQPDYYRRSWSALPSADEALLRAVATLTRTGSDGSADLPHLRGRDVAWTELGDMLQRLVAEERLGADVDLVARSFLLAIANRIAPQPIDAAHLANYLALMESRVAQIAASLTNEFTAITAPGGSGSDYTGLRLQVTDATSSPLFVRVYAAPAGGRLNVGGWGDAIIAVVERKSDGFIETAARDSLTAAGFPRLRDLDSYWMHRAIWPAETAPDEIASDLAERLRRTGLLI